MIKKILGFLFGVATIAIVVIAAMGYGNYSSIFWDKATTATSATTEMVDGGSAGVSEDVVAEPAIEQDSVAGADTTAAENKENANTTAENKENDENANMDKGTAETSSEEISGDGE